MGFWNKNKEGQSADNSAEEENAETAEAVDGEVTSDGSKSVEEAAEQDTSSDTESEDKIADTFEGAENSQDTDGESGLEAAGADQPTEIGEITDGEVRDLGGGSGRRRGRREPLPKKKKIIIAVIATVLILAILAAIIVPVVFYVKDKIFVSDAEDFMNVDWSKSGKYVYLKKDITIDGDVNIGGLLDIDLNKHRLTINGTLTLGGSGNMTVGTRNGKKGYKNDGSFNVGRLNIDTAEGSITLECDSVIGSGEVSAANFTANKHVSLGGDLEFKGENTFAQINGTVNASVADTYLIFTGARGDISGIVQVDVVSRFGAYTVVKGTVPNLNADDFSYAVLDGGRASTVKGGKGALALGAYKCNSFEGMSKLGLFVTADASAGKVVGVEDVFYIEQLPQPSALKIDRDGTKLNLTVSKFFSDSEGSGYANGYLVKINGGEPIEMDGTTMDISGYINSPGRYTVEVMSKGNFAAAENGRYDIDSYSAGTYYISSGYKSMQYDYTITLNAPSGAEITVQEGKHKLQFGTVPFADYYNAIIGDTTVKISNADMERDGYVYIDDYLGGMVGSVVVYIEACSDNEQILTSERTMASTVVTVALLPPSATYNLTGGNLAVTWSKSDNGIFYEVTVKYVREVVEGEEISEINSVVTSLTSYTFEMGEIDNIVEVSVKALAHGYYDASEPAIAAKV